MVKARELNEGEIKRLRAALLDPDVPINTTCKRFGVHAKGLHRYIPDIADVRAQRRALRSQSNVSVRKAVAPPGAYEHYLRIR